MSEHLFLVADVGGTNTRVGFSDGVALRENSIKRFRNAEHAGIETILKLYLAECDERPYAAAVDVAGPVRDQVGELTNLDWTIDPAAMQRATATERVAILNDLQAQGHGLAHIQAKDLMPIVATTHEQAANATRLVVNVGTGFNAVTVLNEAGGTIVPASEAGHANLPIRTETELRLCQFVETAHGFPAIEDVLSGRGLERVFHWLSEEEGTPKEANAADIMAQLPDRELAYRAASVFAQILGRVTGNLALVHLPFGGIYLVGGVARAFGPHLLELGFCEALLDKGRFAGFMRNFSVDLIEDDYAALRGLASHLQQNFGFPTRQ